MVADDIHLPILIHESRSLNTKWTRVPLSVKQFQLNVGTIGAGGYADGKTINVSYSGYHPLGVTGYMNTGSVRPYLYHWSIDGSTMICTLSFANPANYEITGFGCVFWVLYVSTAFQPI